MFETLWRRARRSARLCAVVVFLVPACNGGGTSGQAAVGDSFARRAIHACEDALAAKQEWRPFPVDDFDPAAPDAAAFPKVADWLDHEVAPTFHGWLDDLEALGTPPSGSQDWKAVLAAVERIVRLNDDQIRAAKAGDVDAFAAATDGLEETQTDLVTATNAAGVEECAEVHAS